MTKRKVRLVNAVPDGFGVKLSSCGSVQELYLMQSNPSFEGVYKLEGLIDNGSKGQSKFNNFFEKLQKDQLYSDVSLAEIPEKADVKLYRLKKNGLK